MNLNDCLAFSSIGDLQRIAKEHKLSIPLHSKSILLQELLGRFHSTDFLQSMVDTLSKQELLTLKMLLFSGRTGGRLLNQTLTQIKDLLRVRRHDAEMIFERLVDKGLVYRTGRRNFHELCVVPVDMATKLLEIFSRQAVSSKHAVPTPPHYRQDNASLTVDVFRFAAYIAKSHVRVTGSGDIYKRSQKIIKQGLIVKGKDCETWDGKDLRLLLIKRYASERNLIVQDDDTLKVDKGLPAWLSLGTAGQLRDIINFWKDFYGCRNGYSGYSDVLLTIIATLPHNRWFSHRAIIEYFGIPESNWSVSGRYMRCVEFLHHLMYMGILALSYDEDEIYFKVTDIGLCLINDSSLEGILAQEGHFFTQPNYEILVPQSIDKRVLWQLEELAELVKADQMMIYKISKKSMYYGLQQGWMLDQIIAFLNKYSKSGLPQNVETAIADWAAAYGLMYFVETCLLRCANEDTATEIAANPRFAQYVQGRITDKDLLVSKDDYEEFLKALQKEGYMPKVGLCRL